MSLLDIAKCTLDLPASLPNDFTVKLPFQGQYLTLKLEKNQVFGENTRFLVSDGEKSLVPIDLGLDRSYLGTVAENSNFTVSAVLSERGLIASVLRPGEDTISVEPLEAGAEGFVHKVSVNDAGDQNSHSNNSIADSIVPSPSPSPLSSDGSADTAASITSIVTAMGASAGSSGANSTATLRPTRVMDVLEYEIGVEIGSRAFLGSAYNGNLSAAQASAQSIIGNLDARYLRAAGIKYKLGTVIIRTDAATDPLRDTVTATGAGGNANSSLSAFRNYWNANPAEVGTTHDLAVYHVFSSPSGLAYVNSVGSSNRYATSGGRGATSWANGTLVHEFGHSWNLRHVNDAPISNYNYGSGALPPTRFYESKPRNNSGSSSAGGSHTFVSIMDGRGQHNIGRLATDEANIVYAARQSRRQFGTVISSPGQIPPFGHRDSAVAAGGPVTIDVIANDYDANNDVLDVQLLDTVSQKGGTITLSAGTGPGGRNELIYTPSASASGPDFFNYTVCDTTGRTDWGAVYINNQGTPVITVDTTQTSYNYDPGTPTSPVFSDWVRLSPDSTGDVSWSGSVNSIDRGSGGGTNAATQDLVFSSATRTLRHKLASGIWTVHLNMGDRISPHNQMRVSAEGGQVVRNNINNAGGQFPAVIFDVTVTDGRLDLEFSDTGGNDPNWVLARFSLTRKGDAPSTQTPFGGTARAIPGLIQVEDFDEGGQDIAYNDLDTVNRGGQGRTNDGVDMANAQDTGGGLLLGWTRDGEWLEYTVNVAAGTYDVELRTAAAPANPGGLQLSLNGSNLGTVDVTSSGGWQTHKTDTLSNVTIPAATNGILRLTVVDGANFNVNWIRFTEVSAGGGNNGGDTGGNTGGDTGGNTGGDTGGNTGGDTGGNTGGDTGGNSGGGNQILTINSVISLKGTNDKYVSSENGNANGITCSRNAVGGWERFTVIDAGGGQVAFRGNNGRYISSEDGTRTMTCNSSTIGATERFTVTSAGSLEISLQDRNGRYVSSENGNRPMNCNRSAVGGWERFTWKTE